LLGGTRGDPAPGDVRGDGRVAKLDGPALVEHRPAHPRPAAAAAAAAAAAEDADPGEPPEPPSWRFDPPPTDTRGAVWRDAGPLRSAAGLERLLDDPYPLARLIARFALERQESRGSHRRLEYPERYPELDGWHIVCRGDELRWQAWA
jgi:L-aspartate oxidase